MVLKVNEVFPVSEVDVVLNGVETRIVVEIDDEMRDGYIHVRCDVLGMLPLCGSIEITHGRNGKSLRINVTDMEKLATDGISVGSQPQGDFSTTKGSEVLRQVIKPRAQVTLIVGSTGLKYRITD